MTKQKIVFLGREIHLRTKSDEFFVEILKEVGDVTVLRREAYSNAECIKYIQKLAPELLIFYQLPPSVWHHLMPLRGIRKVWVPMYDGFKELSWKKRVAFRLAGVEVISFCQRIHDHVVDSGLSSQRVCLFPEPDHNGLQHSHEPPYTAFLWQRDRSINLQLLTKLFPAGHIQKVIFKSDLAEPTHLNVPFEVEHLEGWLSREALLEKIRQADYYIAPRHQEGIGFSFLEAMAMGKIVVGHNDATMNEYIQDGVTGHLFDSYGPLQPSWPTPAAMQSSLEQYCHKAHIDWKRDRQAIKDYLSCAL
ncbi:MAG: glycosyltransferase [Chlamydiales bacterium]|nr:glycosyltransferase [Chlamydiales bacterium]